MCFGPLCTVPSSTLPVRPITEAPLYTNPFVPGDVVKDEDDFAGIPHTSSQCCFFNLLLRLSGLLHCQSALHSLVLSLLNVSIMSNASLPPNAPMMNGTVPNRHGEADVPSSSLEHVCAQLHSQVHSFLAASPSDDVTRRTQEQTKIALGVIEQALADYE